MLKLATIGCGRGGRTVAAVVTVFSSAKVSTQPPCVVAATAATAGTAAISACYGSPGRAFSTSAARLFRVAGQTTVLAASGQLLPTSCLAQLPVRRYSGKGLPPSQPPPPRQPTPPLPAQAPTPDALSTTRHENIYTLPNFLTAVRLAAAPCIGYLIVHDQPAWALSLLAAAAVSDLLDGWIARRWNQLTVVGSILDPMADKVLMTVLTVSLSAQGSLPPWLAVLVLGRDVGLGIAAIYYRWISLPPPKTFARYWDFSLPSAEVRPTIISKYNTFLQLALMAATTAAPVLATAGSASASGAHWDLDMGPVLTAMQYIVAVTTVWSGASYIFSKDAVRILTQQKR